MPRELQPCGTLAARMRHVRNGEDPCDECREVYLANQAELRQARRDDPKAAKARKRTGRHQTRGAYLAKPVLKLPKDSPDNAHHAPCFGDQTGRWDGRQLGEPLEAAQARWSEAVALCRVCPVLEHCERSQRMSGSSGVWAGQVLDRGAVR